MPRQPAQQGGQAVLSGQLGEQLQSHRPGGGVGSQPRGPRTKAFVVHVYSLFPGPLGAVLSPAWPGILYF